jgi:hypothetical protein
MITQKFNQGKNEIKIETAENIEDMKKNGFVEGQYSRYYVNGKQTENYMAMIGFIVEETKKNRKKFIPDEKSIYTLRDEMLKKQYEAIQKEFEKIKEYYTQENMPMNILHSIEDMIKKVDITGIRIQE